MKNKIITNVPRYKDGMHKDKVNYKDMIGMSLDIIYLNKMYKVVVVDYIYTKNNNRLLIDYNGYIKEDGIECNKFLNGNFGGILNITKSSKNKFEYSDEYDCWFGYTQKGERFAFDGDEGVIELIKKNTWRSNKGAIESTNLKTSLHRLVYGEMTHSNTVIDHISNEMILNNKWYDNRRCNLREVSIKENSKNKQTRKENKYTGMCSVGGKYYTDLQYCHKGVRFSITTKRKKLEEAIIDNLITQRYLGCKHQEECFYQLENIPQKRIKEVENLIDEEIEKKFEKHNKKELKKYKQRYDISEDNLYITVYDSKNRAFLMDNNMNSFCIIKNWCCYVNVQKGKKYVMCRNNKGEIYRMHRLLFEITHIRYKDWVIDHINGNSEDNRMDNLIITTHYGNMCNVKGVGYFQIPSGTYRVSYMGSYPDINMFGDKPKCPTFKTENEAILEVERRKQYIKEHRIEFKSKEELDLYLSHKC